MLHVHYEPDTSKAAAALAGRLSEALRLTDDTANDSSVVWLLSGGSNIAVSVEAIRALPDSLLPRLTCLLMDERYGTPGHSDSNWQQLAEAGFMSRGVNFPAVLVPGLTMQDTVRQYGRAAGDILAKAGTVIGQFGIGGDGHIAGILPRSAAVSDMAPVSGYDGGDYQRITMTPRLLRQVSAAYAFAFGAAKRPALQRLLEEDLPLEELPAQLLKDLPEAHLYTDQPLDSVDTAPESSPDNATRSAA